LTTNAKENRMAQLPATNPFIAAMKADGGKLDDAQKNALSKQYDVVITMKITESGSNKSFFEGGGNYTGLPYPMVVALEQSLVVLQQQLVELGAAISTGGDSVPPA